MAEVLGVGIDLIEIDRVAAVLDRQQCADHRPEFRGQTVEVNVVEVVHGVCPLGLWPGLGDTRIIAKRLAIASR